MGAGVLSRSNPGAHPKSDGASAGYRAAAVRAREALMGRKDDAATRRRRRRAQRIVEEDSSSSSSPLAIAHRILPARLTCGCQVVFLPNFVFKIR